MKEIIVNKNNILDSEVTDKNIIENYVFINDNKILLKNHHNSYYFVHEEDLSKKYKEEPFLVKKTYELDYPFIDDKTLLIKKFYLINEKIDVNNANWINIDNVISTLEDNMYNNPRVHDVTKEIIEVMEYLLTIIK